MTEAFLRLPERRILGTVPYGAALALGLAAAPAFAIMTLLTVARASEWPHAVCSTSMDASPLAGMATMYLMMSVFHLAPWLKLVGRRSPYSE